MTDKKSSSNNKRARNWMLIVYPDSAPANWRDILDETFAPWVESPLHDKDTEVDENNEIVLKKSHWHILLYFEGKKSYSQVKEISDRLNAPIPKVCEDARGFIRYMVHLDHPHKYQYNLVDIVPHCGADIGKYFLPSETADIQYLNEMFDYVEESNILYFDELVDYARKYQPDTWFITLSRRYSILFSKYFSARDKRLSVQAAERGYKNNAK